MSPLEKAELINQNQRSEYNDEARDTREDTNASLGDAGSRFYISSFFVCLVALQIGRNRARRAKGLIPLLYSESIQ